MALKDTWADKIDGEDINSADDINQVARAVIELEENASTAKTAKEITLGAPINLTQDFGYYKLGEAAFKQFGEENQSVYDFLKGALSQDDTTIFSVTPNAYILFSGDAAEGEIGEYYTPQAEWYKSAGTYKWGIFKNNEADFTVKSTGITYTTETLNLSSEVQARYLATGMTVTATGSIQRSAVTNKPVSKLGVNLYDDELAPDYKNTKTISDEETRTYIGYRKMFYGATSSDNTIDSAFIRNLSGEKASKATIEVKALASSGHKKIIWAIPTSLPTTTLTFNYWFNNEWHTLSGVTNEVVKVQGANGEAGEYYNVYVYAPAGGVFEADMKTQIIIK